MMPYKFSQLNTCISFSKWIPYLLHQKPFRKLKEVIIMANARNTKEYMDLGELGMENSVRKYKGAKKWERKVTEREFHSKKINSRPRRDNHYDDEEYAY